MLLAGQKANSPISFHWTLEFQMKFRPSRRQTEGEFLPTLLSTAFPQGASCNYCIEPGDGRA